MKIQTALKKIIFLLLIGLIISCKPATHVAGTAQNKATPRDTNAMAVSPAQKEAPHDANNLVIGKNINSTSEGPGAEVKFEGSNNLFEMVSKNSYYFNQNHDVIIIKGNNLIIRLINENIIRLPSNKSDTLVIVGSNQKYVVDVSNSIVPGNKNFKIDTLHINDAYPDYDKSDPSDLYKVAESYMYGIGRDQSIAKAIELFEYAAAKNHTPSLEKLGYLYTGKLGVEKNKMKSLYYYKRGSTLGVEYCKLQMKIYWNQ